MGRGGELCGIAAPRSSVSSPPRLNSPEPDFYADDVNHFALAPGRLAYADALPPRTLDNSQPGTRA